MAYLLRYFTLFSSVLLTLAPRLSVPTCRRRNVTGARKGPVARQTVLRSSAHRWVLSARRLLLWRLGSLARVELNFSSIAAGTRQ